VSLLIRDALVDGSPTSILIRDGVIAAVGGEPARGVDGGGAGSGRGPDGGGADAGRGQDVHERAEGSGRGPDGGGADAGRGQDVHGGPGRGPGDPAAGADRVIDAAGLHAFPSLHNGHTHAAMTLFRGWGDDMPLMQWLQTRIWPAERLLTEDDVYLGARLACLEMIRGGTTYLNDMYWHQEGVARAVGEMGLRAHIGAVFIDFGDADTARQQRDLVRRQLDERGRLGPLLRVALAPHAIYTVGTESLEWVGDVARAESLPVHIHLSETREEVEQCVATHGVRPTALLQQVGLLGPNLVAAHGVYLDPDELALLAEAGATVVTNPTANLKLATGGIFDYTGARAAGLRVALGTDGAASNNNLDMIEEMKIAALVQKHRAADATCLPATDALAMATTVAAEAFGLGSGSLEAGAPADLMLVDLSHPSTQPVHDPVSALVYAANGRAVHTTICAGRVLMHAGVVEVADAAEVVRAAVAAARGLIERAGGRGGAARTD
jgi:5-methylthioadenosine/S-adenosylhomocysteine deaminase